MWGSSKALRVVLRAGKAVRRIAALVFDPKLTQPSWPEAPRKRRVRIAADLLWWLARYRRNKNNYSYYVYGLDRQDQARADILRYRHCRRIRKARNLRHGWAYNYVCVLRDTCVVAQFASSRGLATPKPLAL
jgi:hypothetical protein